MNSIDELMNDLKDNKRGNRADLFKLKNGDNKIVVLTLPFGYSELHNVGIAFEGCGYGDLSRRRYKCYVKDLSDGNVKIANFSYTVTEAIIALKDGERTKFDSFPMPYSLNIKTESAGTLDVKTNVLADKDYAMTPEDQEQLEGFDPISEIITRLKNAQKKKLETDPEFREKAEAVITKKRDAVQEKKEANQETAVPRGGSDDIATIEYPDEEINLDDIPF